MDIKINGYKLDNEQTNIVLDNSKYLLEVAGAGSGKTLTILGKIGYLLEQGIKPNEILCISFTKKASTSLEEKIINEFNISVPVYTFHKLGLEILKEEKYEISDSNLLDDIINHFFLIDIYNYPKLLKLIKHKNIEVLSKTINTFIKLFKCNNYSIESYSLFLKKIKFTLSYNQYKEEKQFLLLAFNIYLLYSTYLKENNEIDFDDMLIKATEYVKKNGYKDNLKYIIIDEYQDTSKVRFNLIKEILKSTNAKLMVVGDDFQSIYRFTGCDLNLFIDFKNYFNDSKILKIENTYRNSQELIKVAGNFVMKNKRQIKKNLKSNKSISKPIVIVYYKDLNKTLNNIIKIIDDDYMILGRNNKDINMLNDNLKDNFLTVHKSKGLEWNNVIIINLKDDILSFPNKIKDEKIFRLVTPKIDRYPYSEERRLFYVALTRTKNKVYLLTQKNNSSIFIRELLNNYKKYIEINKKVI